MRNGLSICSRKRGQGPHTRVCMGYDTERVSAGSTYSLSVVRAQPMLSYTQSGTGGPGAGTLVSPKQSQCNGLCTLEAGGDLRARAPLQPRQNLNLQMIRWRQKSRVQSLQKERALRTPPEATRQGPLQFRRTRWAPGNMGVNHSSAPGSGKSLRVTKDHLVDP